MITALLILPIELVKDFTPQQKLRQDTSLQTHIVHLQNEKNMGRHRDSEVSTIWAPISCKKSYKPYKR